MIIELLQEIVGVIAYIFIFEVFCRKGYRKELMKYFILILLCLIFGCLFSLILPVEMMIALTSLMIILFGYRMKIKDKFMAFVLILLIIYLTISIFNLWGIYIFHLSSSMSDTLGMLLVIGITFIIYCLWKDRFYYLFPLSFRNFIAYAVELFLILTILSYFVYAVSTGRSVSVIILMVVTFELLMLAVIIPIFLINNHELERRKFEKERLEQLNLAQKHYYEECLKREEETRAFRHDTISRVIVLENALKNGDLDKALEILHFVDLKMKGIQRSHYDVGNEDVNVIVNYYLSKLNENYIILVTGTLPDQLDIDSLDLVTVFSNLLSNATESLMKQKHGEITLKVGMNSRGYLIEQKNTCLTEDHYLLTNKDSFNHGFGLNNIKQVVKKYEGYFDSFVKDGYFVSRCFLKKKITHS